MPGPKIVSATLLPQRSGARHGANTREAQRREPALLNSRAVWPAMSVTDECCESSFGTQGALICTLSFSAAGHYRVLKPDGICSLQSMHGDSRSFEQKQLQVMGAQWDF